MRTCNGIENAMPSCEVLPANLSRLDGFSVYSEDGDRNGEGEGAAHPWKEPRTSTLALCLRSSYHSALTDPREELLYVQRCLGLMFVCRPSHEEQLGMGDC